MKAVISPIHAFANLLRATEDARTVVWLAIQREDWKGVALAVESAMRVYGEIREMAQRHG